MTEWGPYDFRYPLLWLSNPTDTSGQLKFEVLGPKGKWKILSSQGVGKAMAVADSFPSAISFAKRAGEKQDIEIVAEYRGPAFTDAFGNNVPAGRPYRFRFRKFFQPIPFIVRWYAFDSTSNPVRKSSLQNLQRQQPVKTETVNKLDYAWWGGIKTGDSSYRQFLTVAEGTASFAKGVYELSVTWDDAVRVYVDGKLVVDQWDPSRYSFDEAPNRKVKLALGGRHRIRVEHVELGGFATLALRINKS